jgi:hypothetical protein
MVRAFEHRAREMRLPRTLTVQHPMGRPFGAAGDKARHHDVLNAAFDLLESATANGTIAQFPKAYRPKPRS